MTFASQLQDVIDPALLEHEQPVEIISEVIVSGWSSIIGYSKSGNDNKFDWKTLKKSSKRKKFKLRSQPAASQTA